MTGDCATPLSVAELVDWERGDLPPADVERVEEHFFSCPACAKRLEGIVLLSRGIRDMVAAGQLPAAVTGDLVAHAETLGLRLRSYSLAPGDTVSCTASPNDDFVVVRLSVPVSQDETVDLVAGFDDLESGVHDVRRAADLLVDRSLGEIVYLYPASMIRTLPRSRWSMQAHVHGPLGDRELGPYVLDHTPWEQLPRPS